MAETSIGLSREVKNRLEPVKEEHDASSWNGFMDDLLSKNLGVKPEDLDEYTVEQQERVEQTRATVVGVLEALDKADIVDEVVEIIKALSQQNMLSQNQKIVEHLMEKAHAGGEINEADRLLARMVMETEGTRNHESPAAEIARGLFAGRDTARAERTTTERQTTSQNDDIPDTQPTSQHDDKLGESGSLGVSTRIVNEECRASENHE